MWIVWSDGSYSSLDKLWKSKKTTLRKVISRKLTDDGLIEEQLWFRTSSGIYCYLSFNYYEFVRINNTWIITIIVIRSKFTKSIFSFKEWWTFAGDFISVLGIDIRNPVKNQVFKGETPILSYLERKF